MPSNDELKCPLCPKCGSDAKIITVRSKTTYFCSNSQCPLYTVEADHRAWYALAAPRQPIPNGELESRLREAIMSMNDTVSTNWFEGAINDLLAVILPLVQVGGVTEAASSAPRQGVSEDEKRSDIIGGFPRKSDVCAGCGKPLLPENAWMTDGCPCNTPLGVNSMNETRWRLLMHLQQKQAREIDDLRKKTAAPSSPADGEVEKKLAFLAEKGIVVGWLKEAGKEPRLSIDIKPDSPYSDTKAINKLVDAEVEVERLKFELKLERSNRCDHCGAKTIDRCQRCGAPQCCPQCCTIDDLRTKLADMTTDRDSERTQRKFLQGVRDDLSARLADTEGQRNLLWSYYEETHAATGMGYPATNGADITPNRDEVIKWIKSASVTVEKAKELANNSENLARCWFKYGDTNYLGVNTFAQNVLEIVKALSKSDESPSQPTPPVETPPSITRATCDQIEPFSYAIEAGGRMYWLSGIDGQWDADESTHLYSFDATPEQRREITDSFNASGIWRKAGADSQPIVPVPYTDGVANTTPASPQPAATDPLTKDERGAVEAWRKSGPRQLLAIIDKYLPKPKETT